MKDYFVQENTKEEETSKNAIKNSNGNIPKVFNVKSAKVLILIIVSAVLLPEAFVMLAGLLFDKVLGLYSAAPYILAIWVLLIVVGLVFIVGCSIGYFKNKKRR